MRLAGSGRAEEDDVVAALDEVEGAEVSDDVTLEAALVVEVELLEGLAGREPGGADAQLAAVGLAGGDLTLQAGREELFMRPAVGPGSFTQAFNGLGERRRFQRSAQVGDVSGWS